MKIVHIITGLNNGGAEAVLYRLVTNDKKYKHIVVSLMDLGKYGPMLQDKNIEVICLNMPKGKITFYGLMTLYKTLKKIKPDIVQTWMYHADLLGGIVAKIAGVKKIFWNIRHTNLVVGQSSKATILVAKICAKLSSFVPQKIVCCANKSVEVHSKMGYNKAKMVVIGNGYELDKFYPNDKAKIKIHKELNLKTDFIFGMVGRFDAQKNHKNLLEALSLIKKKNIDFKCLLVGTNMDSGNELLNEWIKEYEIEENLVLLGQRSDIPDIMNYLDLHILSSSFGEAFPNVLCEAMACGIPCVSTDVGDASIIVGKTGWIVHPKNSEELANAINISINEKNEKLEIWKARKIECRKHIEENFSIEKMLERYHDVWELD